MQKKNPMLGSVYLTNTGILVRGLVGQFWVEVLNGDGRSTIKCLGLLLVTSSGMDSILFWKPCGLHRPHVKTYDTASGASYKSATKVETKNTGQTSSLLIDIIRIESFLHKLLNFLQTVTSDAIAE